MPDGTDERVTDTRPGFAQNYLPPAFSSLSVLLGLVSAIEQIFDGIADKKLSLVLIAVATVLAGAGGYAFWKWVRLRRTPGASEASGRDRSGRRLQIALVTSSSLLLVAALALTVTSFLAGKAGQPPVTAPPVNGATLSSSPSTTRSHEETTTTTPVSSTLGAAAKFNKPAEGMRVRFASNVDVSVSVAGLNGRTLWIVTHPQAGDGYYTTKEVPLLTADGTKTFIDSQVGDPTDIGKRSRTSQWRLTRPARQRSPQSTDQSLTSRQVVKTRAARPSR